MKMYANGYNICVPDIHIFCVRDMPAMGIYMLTYEHTCCTLQKLFHIETVIENRTKNEPMTKLNQIISGGIAGINKFEMLNKLYLIYWCKIFFDFEYFDNIM